ncbi:hypothetical protein K402DRAFT_229846 [Aulographum hederae CBS 113979]|uniref:Uncharacterized protein n=1 Tax=Aulographum hederae CBS 113979 TaxID=1176131 RepID=A0A6G1HBP0_9PEZI|nr:hypothetical protein K402DRAFT_229846 [Aulographum hederae CBS 113979]
MGSPGHMSKGMVSVASGSTPERTFSNLKIHSGLALWVHTTKFVTRFSNSLCWTFRLFDNTVANFEISHSMGQLISMYTMPEHTTRDNIGKPQRRSGLQNFIIWKASCPFSLKYLSRNQTPSARLYTILTIIEFASDTNDKYPENSLDMNENRYSIRSSCSTFVHLGFTKTILNNVCEMTEFLG